MPATTISAVWESFEVFENKSFKCKVDNCGFHFNPPLRSTTAMRHLSRQHPDVHSIVFFMDQARKKGRKKQEKSADETEPDMKKSRSEAISDEEAMPATTHDLKATQKDESPFRSTSNAERKVHVLQASSAENVQKALPGIHSSAQDKKTKEKRILDPHKAMPKEPPTTSKKAASLPEKEVCKATPSVAEQTSGTVTRVKRKAAIEAEKRIGHLNEWLHQARKEQKEVRAKRTAVRADTNVNEEDDDVDWPVDLILDERWITGKRQLLLRWAGYDASADTWEPVEHLAGAAELLSAFDAAMDDGFDEEMEDDE